MTILGDSIVRQMDQEMEGSNRELLHRKSPERPLLLLFLFILFIVAKVKYEAHPRTFHPCSIWESLDGWSTRPAW